MSGDRLLELRGVAKTFAGAPVLREIDLEVRRGEFMTLLGPSGCGKTTTLRIIAGLESPDVGSVFLDGRDVTADPPYRRDVHTVFQHYALFPHLSVADNVAFGLRLRKVPEPEIARRAAEALSLARLGGFESRRIASLSGGQMQRVALARAIIGRPALLLLDEPLGALDLKLRREMQRELKDLHRRLGFAFVYVTHDQEEAMAMSDRIAVFNRGRIEQLGTPEQIYEAPRTSFVADFVGGANILTAEVLPSSSGRAHLLLEGEHEVDVPLDAGESLPDVGRRVRVGIRPERIRVVYSGSAPAGALSFPSTVADASFLGDAVRLDLRPFRKSPDRVLVAWAGGDRITTHDERGAAVIAAVLPDDVYILEPDA